MEFLFLLVCFIVRYPPEKTTRKQIQANTKSFFIDCPVTALGVRDTGHSQAFLRIVLCVETPHPVLTYPQLARTVSHELKY